MYGEKVSLYRHWDVIVISNADHYLFLEKLFFYGEYRKKNCV